MKTKFWLVIAGCLAVIVTYGTLGPLHARPQTGHPTLERFAAFALLGSALTLATPRRPFTVAGVVVAVAVVLEALQLIAPNRHARVEDAVVKSMGGLCGVAVGAGSVALFRRTPAQG